MLSAMYKPEGLGTNTMYLYGTGRTKYAGIWQELPLSGSTGDVYATGGWSFSYSKLRKGENFRYKKTYDDNGNILSTKNLAALQSHATYDAYNNLTSYRQPGRDTNTKYTLNWGSTTAEKKKHLPRQTTSPLGIITANTCDSENKPTKLTYGSANDKVNYSYDAIGRVKKRTVTVGGTAYTTSYTYTAGSCGEGTSYDAARQIFENEKDIKSTNF